MRLGKLKNAPLAMDEEVKYIQKDFIHVMLGYY